MKKRLSFIVFVIIINSALFAGDFGADGALNSSDFSLTQMLKYAIEDEYLALNEYEAIIDSFGDLRPYTNIIESEKTHIKYLEELYKNHNMIIPLVETVSYIHIPENITEALKIGVNAEILNISMYENFLNQEISLDVREVFEFLKKASENHLRAFERQVNEPSGRGQSRKRW